MLGLFPFRLGGPTTTVPVPIGVGYELYIDSTLVEPLYGWEIVESINAQTTFRCDILSKLGDYRPAIDKEIYLFENGVLLFGGVITQTRERGVLDEGGIPIVTAVTAHDFTHLLQHREDVNETIPPGTLKAALQQLMPYASGLYLDPAQVDGPSLNEIVYEDGKLSDIFEQDLPILSTYNLRVGFDKKVSYTPSGTYVAPYSITGGASSIVVGDITVEPTRLGYKNRVIARTGALRSVANNGSEQATKGVRSIVISASEGTDQIGLDAIANAYLARAVAVFQKKINYSTRALGIRPGQTQTITSSVRQLTGTYLITEVRTTRVEGLTTRRVSAVEGTTAKSDYRDVYKQWNAGNGKKTAGLTTSTSTASRASKFLGGSGIDATRSAVPTWVPASGGSQVLGEGMIKVQLDTDARGGTDAVVTATLKVFTPGMSVQARLYDVSLSAPVTGVSPVVTSLTGQTVSWDVTLNAGAHVYELQLLPGLANEDVVGTGSVE